LRLSAGLGRMGWPVCIITLFEPGEWAGRCGVPLLTLGARGLRDPRLPLRLSRALSSLGTEVVHSSLFGFDWLSMAAASWAGVAVRLASRRSMPEGLPGKRHPRLERFGDARATRVVCCCRAVADAWAELEGGPRGRYETVYTGVDSSAFRPLFSPAAKSAARARLGLPDVPTCICAANLSAVKRHDLLLSAFARVRAGLPAARLLLAGRDDSGGRVAALARSLGVGDAVELLGPRSDLDLLLPACDVGVLASSTEGLPNSVLEYMAAGLAVVSTDVGGVGEAVEAGVSGVLVRPDDGAALAGAIAELLAEAGRAAEMGAAGRRRAEESFDMAESVRAHAELYLRLLGGAG